MLTYPIISYPGYYKTMITEELPPITYKQKLIDGLKQTKRPIKRIKNPNKGSSEDYFYQHLIIWFQGHVYRNYAVKEFANSEPFIPDFFYQDPETNLHIDIEIDEPYDYKTKKPTHYLTTDEMHMDEYRNMFFNDLGWFVIRFSEEQVLRFPNECCYILSNLIFKITGKAYHKKNIKTNLKPTKCWIYEESLEMANEARRNMFLKILEIKKIIEPYFIIVEYLNIELSFKNPQTEIFKDIESNLTVLKFKKWSDFESWENKLYLGSPIFEYSGL